MKIASALLAALLLKFLGLANQKHIPDDGSMETHQTKTGDEGMHYGMTNTMKPTHDMTVEQLTYDKLYSLLMYNRTDFMLIDVRTPQEHADGHIPASFLVPIIGGKFAEHIDFSQLLCGKKFIVTYCRSGRRAAAAAEIINKVVPAKVYPGSWREWSMKNKVNYVPFMKNDA